MYRTCFQGREFIVQVLRQVSKTHTVCFGAQRTPTLLQALSGGLGFFIHPNHDSWEPCDANIWSHHAMTEAARKRLSQDTASTGELMMGKMQSGLETAASMSKLLTTGDDGDDTERVRHTVPL